MCDWAAVSRPQIYYSLRKLEESGLLSASEEPDGSLGPPRRQLAPTKAARRALVDALSAERWVTQRDRPRFSTWLALSEAHRPQADPTPPALPRERARS